MYFRITIPSLQDEKKDEAISFVRDNVMTEFDGTPGLLSMSAAITGEVSAINMSAWENKESSEAAAEKIQATLAEAASFMAAPPIIYEGEAVYGNVYKGITVGEQKPSYMRLVVGVAKDTNAVLNFLKEKVEPIYEDSDGLQITGAIFDGNSAISWNFWDSKEAMDTAVEKLQSALDSESESNLFDGDTLAYMGPVFAANLFRDFNEGDSPL